MRAYPARERVSFPLVYEKTFLPDSSGVMASAYMRTYVLHLLIGLFRMNGRSIQIAQ